MRYYWWLLGVVACVAIVIGVVRFVPDVGCRVAYSWCADTAVHHKLKGGVPLAKPQIVGGTVAIEHEFPWQVWLHPSNYVDVYCGASLINSSWVLTAAHCVAGETAATLVVELGVHDIKGTNPYRQTITLSQIIVHPQYNSNTEDYDMALLHLSKPATINMAVAPVTLATSTDTALYAAGVNAIVSGWGTTSSNGAVSYVLRKVTVPIVANTTCNTNYGGGITDRMLCAGKPQGGVDSCQGDSGGPLIANGAGGVKLIGVVSWGEGCAAAGKPGVYANIINMRSWIAGYVPLTSQATVVVPSATAVAKTATAVKTATVVAKTATVVAKTATVVAKTATVVAKTATVVAKTATVVAKTATVAVTATTTGTGYTTRVGNGSFEAGHTAWTEASTNYPNLIVNDTRIKARSGAYYAWLGGANNETSQLSQSVTVQADAPYLRMYYMIASGEPCGNRYDTAQITMNGVMVPNGDIELCTSKTVNTWQAFTIDLTGAIGKTVTLAITATTDDSVVSHFWIDDVGFVRTATEVIGYYGATVTTAQKNIAQITQR